MANVARMWAKTRNRIFMKEEVRENGPWEQGDENSYFKVKLLIRHAHVLQTGMKMVEMAESQKILQKDVGGQSG